MGLCSSSTQWPKVTLFLLLCDQEILAFASPHTGYTGFHRFRAVDPLKGQPCELSKQAQGFY